MAIYAISDLHLSFGTDKPMDIFGGNWENHTQQIRENWLKTVSDRDYVLISGDISWGLILRRQMLILPLLKPCPEKKSYQKVTMITGGALSLNLISILA